MATATCATFRTGSVPGVFGARRGLGGPKIDPQIWGWIVFVLPEGPPKTYWDEVLPDNGTLRMASNPVNL